MIVDKQEHKAFLLEALRAITIPGDAADTYIEVRAAVRDAEVAEPAPAPAADEEAE